MALVGDTHANARWTASVVRALGAEGIDVVVQLGDFGWWPGNGFAEGVSRAAAAAGVVVCFLDGNHENHEDLRLHAGTSSLGGGPVDPVEVYPSLWYLPRGCGWVWRGVRFRALGGAYSVDHASRTPGFDLFPPEEVPSAADAERAISGGDADVLLCHDAPGLGYRLGGQPVSEADDRASQQVRSMLAQVVEETRPKLVVHGHHHFRYGVERGGVEVVGLGCDGTDDAVAVLDLATLAVRDWSLPGPPYRG